MQCKGFQLNQSTDFHLPQGTVALGLWKTLRNSGDSFLREEHEAACRGEVERE